jgi:hypothetical protein
MNVIVIYHHPQECGSPYLAFISQETGQVVETIDVPDPEGYWTSGDIRKDIYTPVYDFIEKVNQTPKPTVDNVRLTCGFYPNPKRYVFRVTKVDNIQEDTSVIRTWTADVHIEACRHEIHWEYDKSKDTFFQQLTESGFDMTGWELPIRQKTPFKEFLSSICSKYKDYHLINLIEIG